MGLGPQAIGPWCAHRMEGLTGLPLFHDWDKAFRKLVAEWK